MSEAGFQNHDTPEIDEIMGGTSQVFFTIPLSSDDLAKTMQRMGKNHFQPLGYRNVSIFAGYVTSDIRGTFRGYKCRNSYDSHDTSNIFAYTHNDNDDPIGNTKLFIEKYSHLEYNVR
jgi:hypothetical protein